MRKGSEYVIVKREQHLTPKLIASAVFFLLPVIPGVLADPLWLCLLAGTSLPLVYYLVYLLYLSRIRITIDLERIIIRTPFGEREYKRGTVCWRAVQFGARGGDHVLLTHEKKVVFRFYEPEKWENVRCVTQLRHDGELTPDEKRLLKRWQA